MESISTSSFLRYQPDMMPGALYLMAMEVISTRFSTMLSKLFSAQWFHLWMIVILSSLILFPKLHEGDLSGYDDALYAHEGKQMLITGDWWSVRLNGDLNFEHLPLFMWLEALSMKAFGISDFAAKFPSALSALLTIILVFHIARELSEEFWLPVGSAWALMLSQYYVKYATHAMTDVPFTFFFTLSIFLYIKGLRRPRHLIFCGLAIGFGILTRSILGLLPVGIILGHQIMARQYQRPRPCYVLSGLLVALLAPITWQVSQYHLHGSRFLLEHYSFVSSKILSHGQFDIWLFMRGLLEYPWLLFKLYWPWLPLMVVGLIIQVRRMGRQEEKLAELLVVWVAFVIFPFSLAEAKVLRYIMPVFPAFSMLSAIPMVRWLSTIRKSVYLRVGYLALSIGVSLIPAFQKPLMRAEDMRKLAPIVDAHTEPHQRVVIYTYGGIHSGHINQFLWYSNRFCTLATDPDKLAGALRSNENRVFIVDIGSYEKLVGNSGVRLEMLMGAKNFVCFKVID
jgi:4-amino-4-deoxy-L-arabinose transferase-like glycosyltransferase